VSERDEYPAGVPCWVETLQRDPRAAVSFYASLFGWETEGPGPMPGDPPGEYFVARVRGRDVAGIGSRPGPSDESPAAWMTYVRVESADDAVARATQAGASVIVGPTDAPPAGRLAVFADPTGAVVGVWEGASREGAQVLNEPSAWSMSMLHTGDPALATEFYAAVFGWQAESFGPPEAGLALFRLPGYTGGEPQQPVPRDVVAVMAADGNGSGGPPPHWSVDFWVKDTDAVAEHALALGGAVIVPPHDQPGFRSAVLADLEGASLSINALVAR
jgi:predicted enzyme related to lactoylglutathione lyase